MKSKTAAIVILFNPTKENTEKLLIELKQQCDFVVLVDNTPENIPRTLGPNLKFENVIYDDLKMNMGIAYAQNHGFLKAVNLGCDIFFTFDQDSTIGGNYISEMYNEYIKCAKINKQVAALGPLIINERNKSQYDREINIGKEFAEGVYSVESIISSGALIPLNALTYVGLNKSEWFIDLVDIEWCYRARHLGWEVLSTKNITLQHNIGMQDVNILGVRSFAKCSPFRLYYVYRNWLLANREISFPLKYKIKKLFVMPCKFIIYALSDNGLARIKFMLQGIRDGLKGVSGPHR
ncbi:TPA: glycosyltransferase family 2 protein [Enterobacter cloacae]